MNEDKFLLTPAAGHVDEDDGLTLREHAELIAADLGMVLVPDDSLLRDGYRYRMLMHMTCNEDSPETAYMTEVSDPLLISASPEESISVIGRCLDLVRIKFGERQQ
jgi:hypothetical protein